MMMDLLHRCHLKISFEDHGGDLARRVFWQREARIQGGKELVWWVLRLRL